MSTLFYERTPFDILFRNFFQDEKEAEYIHRGIAKRSFNLGWKIDSKFDLSKASANFADGLLTIEVPFSKGSELKKLQIK